MFAQQGEHPLRTKKEKYRCKAASLAKQVRSCTIASIEQDHVCFREIAMCEVVTLGECMAVLYPREPVTLDAAAVLALDIGGAETNLSIGVSRLGHSARFINPAGADPFWRRMRGPLGGGGGGTTYPT